MGNLKELSVINTDIENMDTDELTAGLVFDPDLTAGRVKELHANTLLSIIEVGRHLILAKEMLDRGEFIPWVEKSCGFSHRTATDYMQMARLGYTYKDKIVNMKANAFKTLTKLPLDLFALAMDTGQLEGKDINDLTKKDILNIAEKARASEEIEKRKRIELEKQNEIGKGQMEDKNKEIVKLEDKIEELKNPNKLYKEQFEEIQEIINSAVYNIQRATVKDPKPEHANIFISSLTVALNNLSEQWGVKWDTRPKRI